MKLSALLENVPVIAIRHEQEVEVSALVWDSRKVKPGAFFCALRGSASDGHDYLKQAEERGAVALLVEQFSDSALPQIQVENSRASMALLAANFYGHPSKELEIAVVTATNGKTTTTGLLAAMLKEAGKRVGVIGTVAVEYDEVVLPSILTTPESVDLQKHLRNMVERGITHVCMEASSIGIMSHRLDGLQVKVAAFNNISPEHLDIHGSFEHYLQTKKSLLQKLETPSVAVYNADEPLLNDLHTLPVRTITFSTENEHATVFVRKLDLSTGRAAFELVVTETIGEVSEGIYPIQLSIPGFHSVSNALSAMTMAMVLGIDIGAIRDGIAAFSGIERRFEFIYENDFIVVDDHFANTGNIDVTLKTMSFMKYNNLHMVYAIRGNRGVQTNRENAESICAWARKLPLKTLIASLSEDFTSKKDKVSAQELQVFEAVMHNEGLAYKLVENLKDAIALGLEAVQPGDVLLLAGCQGMDYGGHLAMLRLKELHPEMDEAVLFKHMEHRVAGIVGRDSIDE